MDGFRLVEKWFRPPPWIVCTSANAIKQLHPVLFQSVASTRQSSVVPLALASHSSSFTSCGDWLGKESEFSSFIVCSTFTMMRMVVFSGLPGVTCLFVMIIRFGMIHCGAYLLPNSKRYPILLIYLMVSLHSLYRPPHTENWWMISRNLGLCLKSFTCRHGPRMNWKQLHHCFLKHIVSGLTVLQFLVESLEMY